MSRSRTLIRGMACALGLALTAGCSGGGLEQPASPAPALQLQVHLAEEPPAGATEVAVGLLPIAYCPISERFVGTPPPSSPTTWFSRPLERTAPSMDVLVASEGDMRAFDCLSNGGLAPVVRFFRPGLLVDPARSQELPWTSRDTVIAYAAEPATFTPFGPTDQPITLPVGYSVLRRSCGLGGVSWLLQVDSLDAPIEFFPPASPFLPQPSPSVSALLEQSERALLPDCGVEAPPSNLGTRVSFDRAASLSFSTDEQELVFLLPIDPADPAQAAPVRSIHLADGSVRQLMIVPDGRNVQTAATGDLFIPTSTTVVQAHVQPDGGVTSRNLPLTRMARVSPDGNWLSDSSSAGDPAETVTLWDVAAGLKRRLTVPGAQGSGGGWSPTSELFFPVFLPGQSTFTYALVAPATGQVLRQLSLPTLGQGNGLPLVWGETGPVELAATLSWTPQLPVMHPDRLWSTDGVPRDFGLALQDLSGGAGPVEVFPVEGGMIQYAASAPGTVLIWARTCLGLFETVCSYQLHRVSVPTGVDAIVAVSDTAAPVALSVSGKRVAIAARDGIYVRDLR